MGDAIRWLTIREVADRACCQPKTIRRAVRNGQLRAARVDGRRDFRFLENWIDEWLVGQVIPEDLAIDVAVDAAPSGLREFSWR